MKECDNCGDVIETSEWYPTLAEERAGRVELYSFCCHPCKQGWTTDECGE